MDCLRRRQGVWLCFTLLAFDFGFDFCCDGGCFKASSFALLASDFLFCDRGCGKAFDFALLASDFDSLTSVAIEAAARLLAHGLALLCFASDFEFRFLLRLRLLQSLRLCLACLPLPLILLRVAIARIATTAELA